MAVGGSASTGMAGAAATLMAGQVLRRVVRHGGGPTRSRDVPYFRLELLKEGSGTAVVAVGGFLTQVRLCVHAHDTVLPGCCMGHALASFSQADKSDVATVSKTKELKKRYGVYPKRESSRRFWKLAPVRAALLSARTHTTHTSQLRSVRIEVQPATIRLIRRQAHGGKR